MLLELVNNPETDIIAALERKVDAGTTKFGQDSRVQRALNTLAGASYNIIPGFNNLYNHLAFLDNVWVLTYLLKSTGNIQKAEQLNAELHRDYNPFNCFNPVTKGFAYCNAIEEAGSVKKLATVVDSMDFYAGKSEDPLLKRMYPFLSKISEKRRVEVENEEKHLRIIAHEIAGLIVEGDRLAQEETHFEAAKKYEEAAKLAQDQLHDEALADFLYSRQKGVPAAVFLEGQSDAKDSVVQRLALLTSQK